MVVVWVWMGVHVIVLTITPMAPVEDLGRANTSSSMPSGSVSLMMDGGENSKLESPASDLLYTTHHTTPSNRTNTQQYRNTPSSPSSLFILIPQRVNHEGCVMLMLPHKMACTCISFVPSYRSTHTQRSPSTKKLSSNDVPNVNSAHNYISL
jgi:hypothetical protein